MARFTRPLREEHVRLQPHIRRIGDVADLVGEAELDELRPALDDVYEFLARKLVPHMVAKERALYPLLATAMGSPGSTATMRLDHVEIARLTRELGILRKRLADDTVSPADISALRRALYGLATLVRLHLAKEEELYLPLLDRILTEARAREMFRHMTRVTLEARQKGTPGLV
jgi:iron-sulfur cluster repair protein YtfE (RIC family)